MTTKVKKPIWRYPWDLLLKPLEILKQDIDKLLTKILDPILRKEMLSNFLSDLKRFFSKFNSERITREAGSLTYITILGFVPFIVFILMLAPDLPFLNLKEKVLLLISDNFMPTSAMAISGVIEGFLARKSGFNIFGFVLMMISSYSLFRVIRDTFDRILKMDYHLKPDIFGMLTRFLGTVILGGVIMVLLFSSSSLPLVSRLTKLPILSWMTYVLPFVMQFLGIAFLYLLMPSIKVKRVNLIRGAFFTTVIWVLAKSIFDFYIYRLTNFQVTYGVFAVLPIFLMWIYVNWVIILGGIVMVHTMENKNKMTLEARSQQKVVRVTLELIAGSRITKKLEKYFSTNDLKDISTILEDDTDEQ